MPSRSSPSFRSACPSIFSSETTCPSEKPSPPSSRHRTGSARVTWPSTSLSTQRTK
ncbi:MAG: hypothetical protein MZV64_71185 [Ignavibacteriales bacterium]|nr:hypothetical protein [Ignavibacteriales bacterium]